MHKVCEKLKTDEHYFVCDKDAIVHDNDVELKDNRWLGKKNTDKKYDTEVRKRILEGCKVFFWRHGTIKDMAISRFCRNQKRKQNLLKAENTIA